MVGFGLFQIIVEDLMLQILVMVVVELLQQIIIVFKEQVEDLVLHLHS